MLFSSLIAPVFLALSYSALAAHSDSSIKARHSGKQRLAKEVAIRGPHELSHRASGARFSWFVTGLGACGNTNGPGDFIVAMSRLQFDQGDQCGKTITIKYKGKTAQATIQDRCVECPYNALDFTEGLFTFFASKDEGYLYGDWEYGSGSPEPTTTKKPEPTTTKKPDPTTTSTYTPPTTTKTSTTSSSSSSTSSSSSSSSKSSSSSAAPSTTSSTSTSSSASASASASASSQATQGALAQVNLAIAGLGGIVAAGAQISA